MSLYVVSTNPEFGDTIKAALKPNAVKLAASTVDLIAQIIVGPRSKFEAIFIDLATVPDAHRLVGFVKGSGSLRSIKIVAAGSEQQLLALGTPAATALDGMLAEPCDPIKISVMVERLRLRSLSD